MKHEARFSYIRYVSSYPRIENVADPKLGKPTPIFAVYVIIIIISIILFIQRLYIEGLQWRRRTLNMLENIHELQKASGIILI